MRKTKKLLLIFGVALTLFTPVVGLLPPASGTAYAAPNEEASVEEQVKSYIFMRAIVRCLIKSELADGWGAAIYGSGADQQVNEDNAEKYHWFSDGDTYLGMYDTDDSNGKKDCGDEDWMAEGFKIWGWDDYNTAICYSGFKRENQDKGADAEKCRGGTEAYDRDGSPADSANQFINNVNKQYYGKEEGAGYPALTDAMRYWYYSRSFITLCKADLKEEYNPEEAYNYDTGKGNDHLFEMIADDGVTKQGYYSDDKNAGDKVTTRANEDLNEVKLKCGELVNQANKYAKAYAEVTGTEPGETNPTANDVESGAIDTSCAGFDLVALISLEWITCPIIEGVTAAANGLENVIAGMLCINESSIFGVTSTCHGDNGGADTSKAFHNAWNVFRILALGMLAIAGLIMVIAQGFGFEIFDAYTVKKTLPRILIAGIGITLSWQLMEFAVSLSNGLGIGVRAIIYAPFLQSGIDTTVLTGGSSAIAVIFAAGAWFVLGPVGLLTFIGTALLAIIIAFFTLIIRNIIVLLLIMAAPLAIAAYVLPNTEKYYKAWWDWLLKALLVFPIITAFIAIGHVFAAVTSASGDGLFTNVVAFAAYFAPYFMIPLAFRFAGGLMATLGGFANDRSRGAFDRLKKVRKGQSEKRMGYYGQKYGNRVAQQRISAVRRLNSAASKDGRGFIAKKALRSGAGIVGGLGDIEERASAIQAAASKRANDQIATGKDDSYRGLTVNKELLKGGGFQAQMARQQAILDAGGTLANHEELVRSEGGKRQYKSLGGAWIDEADAINGHNEYKNDVGAQQAALSYEMRKAMESGQVEGIGKRFADTANAWGMTQEQAQGAWIGSGFENQNTHLALKNTKLKYEDGKLVGTELKGGGADLLNEMYEKKGSYPLSQMSGHTIDQATVAAQNAKDVLASETSTDAEKAAAQTNLDKAKSVAETFMHNMGGSRNEDGAPVEPGGTQPTAGTRTVNANGAGAVNEAVYRLANVTGVVNTPPDNPASPPGQPQMPGQPQTNPPQYQGRRQQEQGGPRIIRPGDDDFNVPPGSLPRQ